MQDLSTLAVTSIVQEVLGVAPDRHVPGMCPYAAASTRLIIFASGHRSSTALSPTAVSTQTLAVLMSPELLLPTTTPELLLIVWLESVACPAPDGWNGGVCAFAIPEHTRQCSHREAVVPAYRSGVASPPWPTSSSYLIRVCLWQLGAYLRSDDNITVKSIRVGPVDGYAMSQHGHWDLDCTSRD